MTTFTDKVGDSVSRNGGETSAAGLMAPAPEAFQCAVSADLVRRAMLVTSKAETRYYLQGVHVSPCPEGGAYIVGTDGRALAIFHDPEGVVSGSAILAPNEHTVEALKGRFYDKSERVLFADDSRLYVAIQPRDFADILLSLPDSSVIAAQYERPVIDGKYPDWRLTFRAIDPEGVVPALDTRHLKRLARALQMESKGRQVILRPTGKDHNSPVWVFGDFKGGAGVIMGCRWSAPRPTEIPIWVGEVSAPKVGDGAQDASAKADSGSTK